MLVKSEEHSAILLTFIKLPFVIKICVLSIFEWPIYTSFHELAHLCLQVIFIYYPHMLVLNALVVTVNFVYSTLVHSEWNQKASGSSLIGVTALCP